MYAYTMNEAFIMYYIEWYATVNFRPNRGERIIIRML